ncbi:Beta-hexosaminidase subunit alpha [Fasciola gigantica]|uniref:Beta-hexosaminidase n=1 Tax=Fasciola gigantica TaxID=46835 RepID=A0A504YRS3_FASGI|nr:Beta-hexosaminidase subunit alpha [Fasciola gigantica]
MLVLDLTANMIVSRFILSVTCVCSVTFGLVPRPNQHIRNDEWHSLVSALKFQHHYQECFVLLDAQHRLTDRLRMRQLPVRRQPKVCSKAAIQTVSIALLTMCNETAEVQWPTEAMHEQYTLIVSQKRIDIQASQVWGALHALETVAQLVRQTEDNQLIIEVQTIYDAPRFTHRGFLIDTARHYLSLESIRNFLDAMAMVKMNVLHWHIVDDESFPFQSITWSNLSRCGAYDSNINVYSHAMIREVLHYARQRGIRVMPEFDTPGHSQSWGNGYPELLTTCYSDNQTNGNLGPINPTTEYTYAFLLKLFLELRNLFPDNLLHLGGDEVDHHCWASNPEVKRFMEEHKFGENYSVLQTYYFEQIIDMLKMSEFVHHPFTPVAWQEVFDRGFRERMSANLSVSRLKVTEWLKISEIDCYLPSAVFDAWCLAAGGGGGGCVEGTLEEQTRVLGGEAALWGEFVDDTNLFSRAWPRGIPAAERLWSKGDVSIPEFSRRLDEIRCQMVK